MDPDDTISDEPSGQEGRIGGEATAFEMPVLVSASDYLRSSVMGSLIAIVIFLGYSVAVSAGESSLTPLRVFASLVLGDRALSPRGAVALAVVAGLLSALAMSLLWGLIFGLFLAGFRGEWTPASIVSAGMVYGSVVWLFSFYVLSPVFWPWVVPMSSAYILLGFVFFFGLPLGAWVASRMMK